MKEFILTNLPFDKDVEIKEILKKSISSNKALALAIVESLQIKNSKFYINVELFARLKKGI